MNWDRKKIFLASGFLIAVVLAMFLLIWLPSYRTNRDLRKFYNEFGFSLPEDTSILYKKSAFGAMGDGEGLVIYQLSSDKMKEFAKKAILKTWSELPVNKEIYTELVGKIGISDEEMANLISLGWQEGFYFIKDRFLSYNPEQKAELNDGANRFHNFTLGVIDTKGNQIYLYRYNQ